jgi:putative endonuclease
MTKERIRVGKVGEIVAQAYLEELGYTIIDVNYRCPIGEIDIVARDEDTVVLVEVRTKTSRAYGSPEESINQEKARRLRRLALYYLQSKRQNETRSRIDLLAVILTKETLEVRNIRHIKGILSG